MKAQYKKRTLTVFLILAALFLPSAIIAQQSLAQTPSQIKTYCENEFKGDYKTFVNPCIDGHSGKDCTLYAQTHDQEHVNICNSERDKPIPETPGGGSTPGGTPASDTPSTPTKDKDALNQLSDQAKQQQANKEAGGKEGETGGTKKDPNSIPDNNYGKYVNGRGDLQPLRITKASGSNRPAIVFFNGGGWHTDDGTGDKVAKKAAERGYTTIVATYRLGSSSIYYAYDDVMRAVQHVRNNAAMYSVDPARIAVWGDSAGGSLAMRVAASGKSGAAAAVGWSAPTNAYTALFRSLGSFVVGIDHSTCVPTDYNGVMNVVDELSGKEGTREHDGGVGNNGTAGTDGTPLGIVTEVLKLAQTAQQDSKSSETPSKQLKEGEGEGTDSAGEGDKSSGSGEGEQNIRRLATKKFLECMDNFNVASPALFASPLAPPTFLAGFRNDPSVGPDQAYQMRDKLRSMGIASTAMILPGVVSPINIPGKNHLGYGEQFVGASLDFLDRYLGAGGETVAREGGSRDEGTKSTPSGSTTTGDKSSTPSPTAARCGSGSRSDILGCARQFDNLGYSWGGGHGGSSIDWYKKFKAGSPPSGLDCSGLVRIAISAATGKEIGAFIADGGGSSFKSVNGSKVQSIAWNQAQAGDIIINSGHMEVVDHYNKGSNRMHTFGAKTAGVPHADQIASSVYGPNEGYVVFRWKDGLR